MVNFLQTSPFAIKILNDYGSVVQIKRVKGRTFIVMFISKVIYFTIIISTRIRIM